MKTRRIYLFLICMLLLSGSVSGQALTTMGTDFWFAFVGGASGQDGTLSVTVTGSRTCSGTLIRQTDGRQWNFEVPAHGSTTIDLSELYSENTESAMLSNKPKSVIRINQQR